MIKNCEHEDFFGICLSCSPPDEWTYAAPCRDNPDLMFPENEIYNEAKRVCESCPVISYCLEIGLHEKFGVWGGLDPIDRHRLLKNKELPKDRLKRRKFIRIFAYTN